MSDFFASGHVVDFIVAVMAAELAWIALRRRARLGEAVIALLPGLCLLLALRAALTAADWRWVALWLTASLPAHLIDMRRRLR